MNKKKVTETHYERNATGYVTKKTTYEYYLIEGQVCDEDCADCDQCCDVDDGLEIEADVEATEVCIADILNTAAAVLTFAASLIFFKKAIKLH